MIPDPKSTQPESRDDRHGGVPPSEDWIILAAELITHNPTLRAEYFMKPDKIMDRAIRQYRPKGRQEGPPLKRQELRAQLGDQIEKIINKDTRLVSARESYFERRAFLAEALSNPQLTFQAILGLSIAAFFLGGIFLIVAVVAALRGEAEISGLFGAGSIVSILGTTLTLSRDSIRQANADNTQIRLILTDFATELTHFRAIRIRNFEEAKQRNHEIRTAVAASVMRLQPREPAESAAAANGAADALSKRSRRSKSSLVANGHAGS